MASLDPELLRLLVLELERHVVALEARPRDVAEAQRAVHAVKGSAGLAGERELAAAFERIARRIGQGDSVAFDEAEALARGAAERLSSGQRALESEWPIPPADLAAFPLDPLVRAQYASEMNDRLARIDEALAATDDPLDAALALYRHVHTMKGAASAVGDEPMSWFCHGLEERLKGADSPVLASACMLEVARWRGVLAALLDEPESALAMLRSPGRPSSPARASQPVPPATRLLESEPPRSVSDSATIRVRAAHVDGLVERFDVIDSVREGLASGAEHARETAATLRGLRASLVAALRLIGAPRPWGAPAAALARMESVVGALGPLGDELDGASTRLQSAEHSLRDGVASARKQLSTMRQTIAGRIFARLTTAIESEARRSGRVVVVRTRGADETIDRRIAEHLVEPCLQLVRNAVAHGIETPKARAALGKPGSGTIVLVARRIGNRLSLAIEDDGAGVDVAHVRARAVEAGLVAPAIAETADDDTLLSLLFLPGFSTRESSDLLAGRGIGLDIARSGIQRLGGRIRISSRAGEGFSARIDVPVETGLVTVLWLVAGGEEFAIPAANARRVRKNDGPEALRVPHLLSCLDGVVGGPPRFAFDLELQGDDETPQSLASLGVDAVGRTEELLLRPFGPLVSRLGPFAGAIVRGDGSLRLAIDAWAIAPRARAVAAMSGSGLSS
jgi:two-component system, chemotaxis family, sensor kinase CheA